MTLCVAFVMLENMEVGGSVTLYVIWLTVRPQCSRTITLVRKSRSYIMSSVYQVSVSALPIGDEW